MNFPFTYAVEAVAVLITALAIHVTAGAQRSSLAAKYLAGSPEIGVVLTPQLTRRLRIETWLFGAITLAILFLQPAASGLAIALPVLGFAAISILRWRQFLETARNRDLARTPIRKAVLFAGCGPGPSATITTI